MPGYCFLKSVFNLYPKSEIVKWKINMESASFENYPTEYNFCTHFIVFAFS